MKQDFIKIYVEIFFSFNLKLSLQFIEQILWNILLLTIHTEPRCFSPKIPKPEPRWNFWNRAALFSTIFYSAGWVNLWKFATPLVNWSRCYRTSWLENRFLITWPMGPRLAPTTLTSGFSNNDAMNASVSMSDFVLELFCSDVRSLNFNDCARAIFSSIPRSSWNKSYKEKIDLENHI